MTLEELGCDTRLLQVVVPGATPLVLCGLQDRQQFSDPYGTARQLGISSALWPLSGLLWPSAYYLAAELLRSDFMLNINTLEIGCGLALPSLVAHRAGYRITASDHNPLSAAFLRENLELNQLAPSLPYRYGHWGKQPDKAPEDVGEIALTGVYDLIIGSDLLYEPDSAPALASFLALYAGVQGHVWIVDASRGYRAAFKRQMQQHDFYLYERQILNRQPCLSGAPSYKGRLLKFKRA